MTPEDERRIDELRLLIAAEEDGERLKTLLFEFQCLLAAEMTEVDPRCGDDQHGRTD